MGRIETKMKEDKTAKIVIFVISILIVAMEILFGILGTEFEIKLVVEGASAVLAILVSQGIVKLGKKKTYIELKDEFEKQITEKKEEISSQVENIVDKVSKKNKK